MQLPLKTKGLFKEDHVLARALGITVDKLEEAPKEVNAYCYRSK